MSESLPDGTMPTREEVAQREVGHTDVRRTTSRAIAALFLVVIAVPAALEGTAALRGDEVSSGWWRLEALPTEVAAAWRLPRLEARPTSDDARATLDDGGRDVTTIDRLLAANRSVLASIHEFEHAIDEEGVAPAAVRPAVQAVLSGWLRAGNERVVQGRDGWLFYRPDVEHVIGRGFLEPAELERRRLSSDEWNDPPSPDPRPAILEFQRQLAGRGIVLILVPTPVKPSIEPQQLGGPRMPGANVQGDHGPAPLLNASHAAFVDEMRRSGVFVFDAAGAVAEAPQIGDGTVARTIAQAPLYLATDTHWRPETMARVAERLAAFIHTVVELPPAQSLALRVDQRQVRNTGDTASMLGLPAGHALSQPESVTIDQVLHAADGEAWRPARSADVLVLGDSFSNIYALESMGWGRSAGFVEHLSRALARPVDRIVQNDAGAYATRERLRQEMTAGSDRLAGKRVVVWQFAARELSGGDWKLAP
ncbi:MAG: hypothetical protein AB7Q29_11820 [Vicinamibacterales bacterium]